jgi:hypothetical protein
MIINQNSWHYKVVSMSRSKREVPDNLCSYVRSLVFRLIGISLAVACVLSSFCLLFIPRGVDLTILQTIVVLFGIVGVIFEGIILFLVLIAVSIQTWHKHIQPRIPAKQNKQSGPFVQYIKDKHSKICRSLEFKDGEQ